MSAIQLFEFPQTGQQIRAIDRDGSPWFVGADVCAVLQINNAHSSIARLDDDERTLHTVESGQRSMSLVSESGLYSLILRSRKPEAKAFKRWVTHDVLPSIRKTGGYKVANRVVEGDFFEPHTLTWDETTALIRQRYGIALTVNELTRMLRTAGVLKQTGAPTKKYQHLFWFTGSCWNIHPHVLPELAQKAYDTGRELQDFRFIQARLELEGLGRSLADA